MRRGLVTDRRGSFSAVCGRVFGDAGPCTPKQAAGLGHIDFLFVSSVGVEDVRAGDKGKKISNRRKRKKEKRKKEKRKKKRPKPWLVICLCLSSTFACTYRQIMQSRSHKNRKQCPEQKKTLADEQQALHPTKKKTDVGRQRESEQKET